MKVTSIRWLCFVVTVVATLAISPVVNGQRNFDNVEITTTQLDDNLYYLQGQGGQIGVLAGPDGILMVDTQFAPLTDRIVAAIREISTEPIRFALNTHEHGDHSGGNSNLAAMGVTVMTRDELRAALAGSTNPPERLPMVTYDGPVTFHMNGEIARAIPVAVAHTNGDTMVYFENADVLMTGDFYRSAGYPNIAIQNGGSLEGMLLGLGRVIGNSGPNTRILPGHGPIVDRDEVRAHRDMMLVLMGQGPGTPRPGHDRGPDRCRRTDHRVRFPGSQPRHDERTLYPPVGPGVAVEEGTPAKSLESVNGR